MRAELSASALTFNYASDESPHPLGCTSLPPLQNCVVFLDLDGDRAWRTGEPKTMTDTTGHFSLVLSEVGLFLCLFLSRGPLFLRAWQRRAQDRDGHHRPLLARHQRGGQGEGLYFEGRGPFIWGGADASGRLRLARASKRGGRVLTIYPSPTTNEANNG